MEASLLALAKSIYYQNGLTFELGVLHKHTGKITSLSLRQVLLRKT